MDLKKPDLYNKSVKKRELVEYIEKIEHRLQTAQDNERKMLPWVLYLVFFLSFIIGAGVISIGIYNLNGQLLDWFILIIIIVLLSPIVYLLIKDS